MCVSHIYITFVLMWALGNVSFYAIKCNKIQKVYDIRAVWLLLFSISLTVSLWHTHTHSSSLWLCDAARLLWPWTSRLTTETSALQSQLCTLTHTDTEHTYSSSGTTWNMSVQFSLFNLLLVASKISIHPF